MTRRPAVTLIEVLVSMFIMAIGMLALLVLFPLGAINMAQALKDDRCAATASMAENVAIATNVRHDLSVVAGFANAGNPVKILYVDPQGVLSLPPSPVPASYPKPPFGFPLGGMPPSIGTGIPRVTPSFVGLSQPLADRWFCLPDDVTFSLSGTADLSSGNVQRGQRYSFAYLLKQQESFSTQPLMQLFVVVYSSRPIGATPEPTFTALVTSTNSLQLAGVTAIKRGGWFLDTNGNFYRVTNLTDAGGITVVETQQTVQAVLGSNITIIEMDHVAEVLDKGTSWQP